MKRPDIRKRKCHCGKPAIGITRVSGGDSPYCRNHLPAHRQRFNAACFGALLAGAAKRKERQQDKATVAA